LCSPHLRFSQSLRGWPRRQSFASADDPPLNLEREILLQFMNSIPYGVLVPVAILMALAPVFPKPHLVEKVQMLLAGDLKRPIDIFDLLLHAIPLVLLALKMALSR
jgi:hypothetical protein